MKRLLFILFFVSFGLSAQEKATYVQDPDNCWAIDMTVLTVEGKHYAVWSGWDDYYVDTEAPMQWLYIAPMTFHKEKPYVRLGKRVLLSSPELPFEMKVDETSEYRGCAACKSYDCTGKRSVEEDIADNVR